VIDGLRDADTAPSDKIVENSAEEPQAEKGSDSGFIRNLQSNIGGLFKSGKQTEADKSDSKEI